MHRRRYLAGLPVALSSAGCLGAGLLTDVHARLDLGETTLAPASDEVTATIELLADTVTTAHPGRLRVTIRNHGTSRTFAQLSAGPFYGDQESTPLGLVLGDASADRSRDGGDRWIYRGHVNFGTLDVPSNVEFAPDESFSYDYELWYDPRGESYMQPGSYRFETIVQSDEKGGEIEWTDHDLAFEIVVEE